MKTPEALQKLLYLVYPQTKERFEIIELDSDRLVASMNIKDDDLRPGNTISGPSMFTLADCAFYALILGIQEEEVQAVTTNVGMNFIRRPTKSNLIAKARMIKMGSRLAVGDVMISSEGVDVAHATFTYALFLQR